MWTRSKSFAPLCPVAFSLEWGSVFQPHLLIFPSLQPRDIGEQRLRRGEALEQLGKGVMTLHTPRRHGHASGSVLCGFKVMCKFAVTCLGKIHGWWISEQATLAHFEQKATQHAIRKGFNKHTL